MSGILYQMIAELPECVSELHSAIYKMSRVTAISIAAVADAPLNECAEKGLVSLPRS